MIFSAVAKIFTPSHVLEFKGTTITALPKYYAAVDGSNALFVACETDGNVLISDYAENTTTCPQTHTYESHIHT